MKLQIALDYLSIDEALDTLAEVARFADIAVVGAAITASPDRAAAAETLRKIMEAEG